MIKYPHRLRKDFIESGRAREIIRYLVVGGINTLFGVSIYFGLVYIGVNLFIAQAIGQIIGLLFNYFTYTRAVFVDARPAPLKFVISYLANYPLQLIALLIFHKIVRSPYWAGIFATGAVAFCNYFLLRFGVFRKARV